MEKRTKLLHYAAFAAATILAIIAISTAFIELEKADHYKPEYVIVPMVIIAIYVGIAMYISFNIHHKNIAKKWRTTIISLTELQKNTIEEINITKNAFIKYKKYSNRLIEIKNTIIKSSSKALNKCNDDFEKVNCTCNELVIQRDALQTKVDDLSLEPANHIKSEK